MAAIAREQKIGETIAVGDYEITPVSQVISIQSPSGRAGLVWNRPKSVIIRTADGHETVLPVVDVTREVMWAMLAGGVLGAMLIGFLSNSNKR